MKAIYHIILASFFIHSFVQAQDLEGSQPKVGWNLSAEAGTILHGDHLGKTVGFRAGASFFKRRLAVNFVYYGRSGPINSKTFELELDEGTTYQGQRTLNLRADHAVFGIEVAPQIPLGKSNVTLDVPLMFGQLGAAFYFSV